MEIKIWLIRIVGIIVCLITLHIIILGFTHKDCCQCSMTPEFSEMLINPPCCPCPNVETARLVEDYYNVRISSAGSMDYYCRKYQEEVNSNITCWA